jgi:dipeptidyl aminopeptidase/acylaminoacyl peptidase
MVTIRTAVAVATLLLCGSVATEAVANKPCRDELQASVAPTAAARDISTDDLVRLRDIGRPDEQQGRDRIFSLSPDGTRLAFQLRRADPASNGYCLGIFILSLGAADAPVLVDEGGDLIRSVVNDTDHAARPTGAAALIVPVWAPNSQSVAFLKRTGGTNQVWVAGLDGRPAVAVTHAEVDVEALSWTQDGQSIVYGLRPGLATEAAAIEREAASGFLYDKRFVPILSSRPFVPPIRTRSYFTVARSGGVPRAATSEEIALVDPLRDPHRPSGATIFARDGNGDRAWIAAAPKDSLVPSGSTDVGYPYLTTELRVETATGWRVHCLQPVCDGVLTLRFDPRTKRLLFLKREGPRGTTMALYAWSVQAKAPRRLWGTEDHLVGCVFAPSGVICGRETPSEPRRLVLIDLNSGRAQTLYDPNPEFGRIRLGRVTPLRWRNPEGYEAFGKLVTPPGYDGRQLLPLVLVQYQNRGFLRGGTGDEYPVHVLAARGMAVLALDRPLPYHFQYADDRNISPAESIRRNYLGWADRKSVQSSLEEGIRQAARAANIDLGRMGITGLSEGSTAVQWAILNSKLFSAAAMSSCCSDEYATSLTGPSILDASVAKGRPPAWMGGAAAQAPISIPQHATALNTALLLQSADAEYLSALASFEALRLQKKPVELVVYPDEHHIKWQPAHRAAVYERNVDWFSFWLKGEEDPGPGKAEQYVRWRAMRANNSNQPP